MSIPRWVQIAKVEDCPPGEAREFTVDDRIVALFNVEGTFYALDGICPHQGGPLGEGELSGQVVTCPWHGWQFNVCSGQHELNSQLSQARYPVRVEDEAVFIDLAAGTNEP